MWDRLVSRVNRVNRVHRVLQEVVDQLVRKARLVLLVLMVIWVLRVHPDLRVRLDRLEQQDLRVSLDCKVIPEHLAVERQVPQDSKDQLDSRASQDWWEL
jgi:hypothetical protein